MAAAVVVANGLKEQEKRAGGIDGPTNPMVTPLLTDLYQFTMAYAYWKAGKHSERAVFDLYFRRNPFGGEYTVFAGLEECIRLIANFKFTEDEIAFIQASLPSSCEVVQLLETPLVNLINYASLVATNAARHRFVAGKSKLLLEFGLRRAQGPDGGIGASKYCYMGGFDATSNVAAGKLFGIPLRGTHSHAFVSSFMWSKLLGGIFGETNQSELAAFASYALAFPKNLLALVDTYDVMRSGIPNFCAVALALNDLGYKALGIRLDSGDLAYQSCEARKFFQAIEKEFGVPDFGRTSITASNDLNEETLDALNKQVGERLLCRHPFNESKRAYVVPQRVEELMKCYWPGRSGKDREELPPINLIRERCIKQLEQMRPDHMRRLNPTPYKVSVSAKLYDFIHFLWLNEAPVGELQ
ncbi:UNVERIFIED_CONTAM: Nicotinate phosphoribosyltransferase 2 [Sesamum radiatum]|uniref:nicotinate phosphoribosyltransferase n=1 Tax=Sesamum radiatum TaxID=300843 RepID=A0AAW2P7R3_SESRA